jgi:TldD protein
MTSRDFNAQRLSAAQEHILGPAALSESQIARALATLQVGGVDDADLYFQYTANESWALEEGIVKSGSFSIDAGVGVRAVSGEKTAFAYSDDISAASLMDACAVVKAAASAGAAQVAVKVGTRTKAQPSAKASTTKTAPSKAVIGARDLYAPIDPVTSMDSATKIALLERIEKLARSKDPRIVQVMASLASEYDVVYVARADGTRAADVRPLVRLSVTVIAQHGARRETGSSGGGGRFSLQRFDEALVMRYVDEAVQSALTNLQARPAPAGVMPIVLGPGWPGVLLHEAVGHGLEGDFNRKGSSVFAGRIGQRVAAKGVTVVDDGTMAERRGSLNMDDEGHTSGKTVLIEDGILCGYIQDAMNARLMGVARTGNARRESYACVPMPRMTNTYMLGGDASREEILASIKKGVYAVNFGGGSVDITSGKFVFSASEAYWVENGKMKYPIKGATIVGNGPQSLKQVKLIGNDLALDSGVGVCGKEGQSVPVGVGQPTLRIDGLTVGGTA